MSDVSIFDIIGPVMIGPSSSHTAGAVRIGRMAQIIAGEKVSRAQIDLHGSFARTYKGHGTDLALVAGLLGMAPDNPDIKKALELAEKQGMRVSFSTVDLGEGIHPNTARLRLTTVSGEQVEVTGSSLGGGRIMVTKIDGYDTELRGNSHTLLIAHIDRPGIIARVTSLIAWDGVNIGFIKSSRRGKGANALMIVETDQPVSPEAFVLIANQPDVTKAMQVPLL